MAKSGLKVRGMYRINLVDPDGNIVGDSGWKKNTIVNLGFAHYLCANLVHSAVNTSANSAVTTLAKQVGYVLLGSGSAAPAVDATSLTGELTNGTAPRQEITAALSSNSKAVQFTATFATGAAHSGTAAVTIQQIALVNSSGAGTIFSGAMFTGSSLAANQVVNVTYVISMS